jgi:hypothetical protein
MTTPKECFNKQVKSNACKVFNTFIEGIIILFPLGICLSYVAYSASSCHPLTNAEAMNMALIFTGETLVFMFIEIIYVYIIAVPILNCYFGEDL